MNILIDVDCTLLSANGSLHSHSHARRLFRDLRPAGHTLRVWRGAGVRQAEIEKHAPGGMAACYAREPAFDYVQALRCSPPALPDLIIDEHLEAARALDGPYFFAGERGAELKHASATLLAYALHGICDDRSFIALRQRP